MKESKTTVFHLTKSNLDEVLIEKEFNKDLKELGNLISGEEFSTVQNHFKNLEVIVCRYDEDFVSGCYFKTEDLTKILEWARLLRTSSNRPSR